MPVWGFSGNLFSMKLIEFLNSLCVCHSKSIWVLTFVKCVGCTAYACAQTEISIFRMEDFNLVNELKMDVVRVCRSSCVCSFIPFCFSNQTNEALSITNSLTVTEWFFFFSVIP